MIIVKKFVSKELCFDRNNPHDMIMWKVQCEHNYEALELSIAMKLLGFRMGKAFPTKEHLIIAFEDHIPNPCKCGEGAKCAS